MNPAGQIGGDPAPPGQEFTYTVRAPGRLTSIEEFIPGITGRLYQQFAVTVSISVILSAINALTLSPALSAMLLRPRKPARGPLVGLFHVRNSNNEMVPLSTVTRVEPSSGPEFTMRFNLYRAAQVN